MFDYVLVDFDCFIVVMNFSCDNVVVCVVGLGIYDVDFDIGKLMCIGFDLLMQEVFECVGKMCFVGCGE